MEKLILIDSHALIHRVYHALPKLTTKSGEVVNAVYGFSSILIKIFNELKPDYIAAAFDLGVPTIRHQRFKEYKAHRPKTDETLISQFRLVKDVLSAFNVRVFEAPGFEADDIIATIIKKLQVTSHELQTIIVSGDLDLLQLVDKNVDVLTLKKGITETVTYNLEAIKSRFGLTPRQVIDFKSLKGDPSDNIPGAKGIGEKTAINLLQQFGDLDCIYKNLENIKNKTLKEKLLFSKENVYLSRSLVLLRCDAPIKLDLNELKVGYDKKQVEEILERFDFLSLLKRLRSATIEINRHKEPEDHNLQYEDIQIAVYLLNSSQKDFSLKNLVLNNGLAWESGKEVEMIEELRKKYYGLIKEKKLEKVFYEIELPIIPILKKINNWGIKVDSSYLKNLSISLNKEIVQVSREIYKLTGKVFNINSAMRVSEVISQLVPNYSFKKTKTGKISTGSQNLERLAIDYPLVKLILKYRELSKIKSTYVDNLILLVDKESRLHSTFSQISTATGRLASSNPNLQNIPKGGRWGQAVRRAFISEDGYQFASFDYSQFEFRLAAHLSSDPSLIKIFEADGDIHRFTAAKIKNIPIESVDDNLRSQVKALNFGILYGMSKKSLAETTGLSLNEASEFINEYFKNFPNLVRFIEDAKDEARQLGEARTLFGRLRLLDDIHSPSWKIRGAAERAAVNFKIQGLNADIIKLAMIKIWNTFSLNENKSIRLILQVHDELVFEIRCDLIDKITAEIKEIMETIVSLKVPLKVNFKIGNNLSELS